MQTGSQCLYSVLQYHNYRKEHFLHLIGVFSSKAEAEKVWQQETDEFSNLRHLVEDHDVWDCIRLKNVRIYDDEESEWMIFAIQKIPEVPSLPENSLLDVDIDYEFPAWVSMYQDDPTICQILRISESQNKEEKIDFFTGSKLMRKGEVTLVCSKDKNYKYYKW